MRFFTKYILSAERYDIIHIHYYFPTIICAVLYRFLRNSKIQIIVTCHGSDVYSFSPPNYLYKKLSKYVSFWLFTSSQLIEKFYRQVEHSAVICAGYDDYLMDELVTVTGILRLKREDVSSGVYIMDKATAIKTEE